MERILVLIMLMLTTGVSAQTDNLFENPGFENGTEPWATPYWAKDKHLPPVSDDKNNQGPIGSKSLRLDVDPDGRRNGYLLCNQKIQLPKDVKDYSLSFWVKSADYEKSTKGQITLIVDVYTADRKKKLRFSAGTEWNKIYPQWTFIKKDFSIPSEYTQVASRFSLATHGNKKGSTWVDNVYFGPAVKQDIADTSNKIIIEKGVHEAVHGGVYYPGEKIVYDFYLKDIKKPGSKAVASWQVNDFDGRMLKAGTKEITLDKNFRLELPELGDYRGYYVLKLSIIQNGGSIAKGEYSGIIVERQSGERDPFFSTKGCANYEKHVRMGFGTLTMGGWIFSRKQMEAPGKYNFVWSDKAMQAVRQRGYKNVYGVITMNNTAQAPFERAAILEKLKQGVDPLDEEHFKRVRDYFRAIIKHYGEQGITDWCVPDEVTLTQHYNKFVYKHYIRYVKIFYEELKKYNPSYTFSAGGATLESPAYDYIRTAIWDKIKDHVDGLCVDAYPQQTSVGVGFNYLGPEQLKLRDRFLQTEKVIGPGKYIINEETGSGIQKNLPLDSEQLRDFAVINARMLIIGKSIHSMKRWTWFLVEDIPVSDVFDYAMWKNSNPRPHAATYAVVARALAFAKNAIEVKPNADVYCYVFERKGKTVFALWSLTKEVIDAKFNLSADWQGMDLMGRCFSGKKGTVDLKINERPVFIELDAPQQAVADAIRKGKYATPQIHAVMNRKNADEMNIFIKNKTNDELSVDVSCPGHAFKKTVKVPPLANIPVAFPCKYGSAPVKAVLTANDVKYEISLKEELFSVEKLSSPPAMDGTLKGFEKVKPLVFDSSKFLKPLDAESWGFWKNKDDLSAKVYLAYDNDYFYIAADVTDDIHISRAADADIWNQDCIQYAFDTENNAFDLKSSIGTYAPDDRELCMALTPNGPQNYCYTGPAAISRKPVPGKCSVKIAANGHKLYVACIPWSCLGKLRPEPGTVFGFNVTIFDLDTKDGMTSYYMELSPGIANGKNPAYFKRFILK